jgi:hypothetical protein
MLLDRLWVRIRGQLLTLKEDLFERGELRQKAEDFLDKLEKKLESNDARTDSRLEFPERLDAVQKKMEQAVNEARNASQTSPTPKSSESPTLEELEAAWDELMELRKDNKLQPTAPEHEDEPPKPRRTLG